MLSNMTHLSCLHYCFTAAIPDSVSLVANSFRRFFFWHVSMGFVLGIWYLLLGKPKACSFCFELVAQRCWCSRFSLEQPSESQQTVSEVCVCSMICLVVGVIGVDTGWLDSKIQNRPSLKWLFFSHTYRCAICLLFHIIANHPY